MTPGLRGLEMTTIDVAHLTDMRDRLRIAYLHFAAPRRITIERENGSVTNHVGPSLWAQLLSAVATGSERGSGPRSSQRASIVAASAVDLKALIERQSRRWGAERALEVRVHRAIQDACRTANVETLADMVTTMATWSRSIEQLLTPPKRMHIAHSCPVCNVVMVTRHDLVHGEDVQIHALQIFTSELGQPECTCLHCGALWTSDQLEDLAGQIGDIDNAG